MNLFRQAILAVSVAGILPGPSLAGGASSPKDAFTGSIIGFVTDSAGIPQMGATVLLINRYEKVVQRALTNDKGAFGFENLLPDLYSLRVSLASFVPAVKRNIYVQPGVRSFLSINLASVFSSIELVYSAPGQAAIMSEDWKWVLRSSLSTRPVLRLAPGLDLGGQGADENRQAVFSRTRGVVRVSASDTGSLSALGGEPDLGTAFALATSLFGRNELQLSGTVGYLSATGMPTASFHTSFTPVLAGRSGPEVNLTMRQLFPVTRAGMAFVAGQQEVSPVLRSMTLGFSEKSRIAEGLDLTYGMALESITFLSRLNYASPYARLSYSRGAAGEVLVGFSSGAPPVEAYARQPVDCEFQGSLATLGAFPRLSRRNGAIRVLREQNFEIAYRKAAGKSVISMGAYQEKISNASLTLQGAPGFYSSEDVLPDLFSDAANFHIGDFRRAGYAAQISRAVNDSLNFWLSVGNTQALTLSQRHLGAEDPDQLRSFLQRGRRYWASAKVSALSPWSGTRVTTSYAWTDYSSLMPAHRYLTHDFGGEPGLNLQLRQPIVSMPGVGRLEATAEVRNALGQGYISVYTAGGRRIIVVQSPKSVRGGFSLIF